MAPKAAIGPSRPNRCSLLRWMHTTIKSRRNYLPTTIQRPDSTARKSRRARVLHCWLRASGRSTLSSRRRQLFAPLALFLRLICKWLNFQKLPQLPFWGFILQISTSAWSFSINGVGELRFEKRTGFTCGENIFINDKLVNSMLSGANTIKLWLNGSAEIQYSIKYLTVLVPF